MDASHPLMFVGRRVELDPHCRAQLSHGNGHAGAVRQVSHFRGLFRADAETLSIGRGGPIRAHQQGRGRGRLSARCSTRRPPCCSGEARDHRPSRDEGCAWRGARDTREPSSRSPGSSRSSFPGYGWSRTSSVGRLPRPHEEIANYRLEESA